MKRPLALFERAMHGSDGAHVNVLATTRIRGRVAEYEMQRALMRVQAKHSILRCLIAEEGHRPWFVEQTAPEPIPLHVITRRDDNDWVDVSMRASLQRFDGSQPLARLIWLRGDAESELVLVCSHAICDGQSLLTLLREILLLCDQPDADIGGPTSLNALDEIMPPAVLADRRLQRAIRWRVVMLKLLLRFAGSGSACIYGTLHRSFSILDREASQSLVARCKAEGVTVFAALAVAVFLAFRGVCGATRITRFESPVDMRKFLPDLRPDSLFPVAPVIVPRLPKRQDADRASSFWPLARELTAEVIGRIDRLKSSVYRTFLGMEHLHDVYDRMLAYGHSKRAGRKVSLSYLGKLDLRQEYRHFHVSAVCDVSAMIVPTPANLVVIYDFADQFHFTLASDESSLPRAQAIAITDRVKDILRSSLGERVEPAVSVEAR